MREACGVRRFIGAFPGSRRSASPTFGSSSAGLRHFRARRLMKSWLLCMALLVTHAGLNAQTDWVAIRAGRLLPISSKPVRDGVILLKNGQIEAIGPGITIPPGAKIIEATNDVVMPGLVDAGCLGAVRGDANEQSNEITPDFHILAALDPESRRLQQAVQTGVTTVYLAPGWENVVGGRGAVIRPVGRTIADMVLKEEGALTFSMGRTPARGNRIPYGQKPGSFYFRRPTTTMAVNWMLRKVLFDAQQGEAQTAETKESRSILQTALRHEQPVHIRVRRAIDIRTALRLVDEFGLKIVLIECTEGYKMADELARRQIPVILGPFYFHARELGPNFEGQEVCWNNAGLLHRAGVKVMLASQSASAVDLLSVAAYAVRHGLPREAALKAITLSPAECLGVANRVGSLDTGKDGNLIILSGDPLQPTTLIKRVLLQGKTIYQAEQGDPR